MRIMGIDPSTNCGICLLQLNSDGEDFEIVVKSLHDYNMPKSDDKMERLAYLGGHIEEFLEVYKPEHVVIEGYSFGSKFQHEIMYSIGTVIRYIVWQRGYNYIEVPPHRLKKFVTGKGTSKKELMMLKILENWGVSIENNNMADAFALALIHVYELLGILKPDGTFLKRDAEKFLVTDLSAM